jgi:hypothetical protein
VHTHIALLLPTAFPALIGRLIDGCWRTRLLSCNERKQRRALTQNSERKLWSKSSYLRGEILTIAFPMRPWARADGMSGQIFALRRECQIICGALNGGEQGPLLSDFAVRRFPPWSNQTAIHAGNSSLMGLWTVDPLFAASLSPPHGLTKGQSNQNHSLNIYLPICFHSHSCNRFWDFGTLRWNFK